MFVMTLFRPGIWRKSLNVHMLFLGSWYFQRKRVYASLASASTVDSKIDFTVERSVIHFWRKYVSKPAPPVRV